MFAELLALLRGRLFQGAGGQTLSGSKGHLFHLGQIDIQARPFFAKSLPHHNFSPLLRKTSNGLQLLRRQLPYRHNVSILEVREIRQGEFPFAYPT